MVEFAKPVFQTTQKGEGFFLFGFLCFVFFFHFCVLLFLGMKRFADKMNNFRFVCYDSRA